MFIQAWTFKWNILIDTIKCVIVSLTSDFLIII